MKHNWAMTQLFKLYDGYPEAGSLKYFLYFCIFQIVHTQKKLGENVRETLEKNKNALNFRERVLCL